MQTKMSNGLLNKDGLEYFIAPQRLKRAIKNAHRLHLFPVISDHSDVISIHIDRATLEKLGAICDTIELEIFKLLISGYNQTEVAQQLNISQSNVSRKVTQLKFFLHASK